MTRSSKSLNSSRPRNPTFGTFSAAAVAILLLFLYLWGCPLAGDLPPPAPLGSWKQVHRALGISLRISPTTPRKRTPTELSPTYNLHIRLSSQNGSPESHRDKTELLQDFAAVLQSILGKQRR